MDYIDVISTLNKNNGKMIDFSTGCFIDIDKSNIYDPTLVLTSALENAVSVVSMLITTECIVK